MNEDLRKAATKKVEAKKAFYSTAMVFSAVVVVLMILCLAIPSITFWLLIPLPVLAMVLGVVYMNAFGFPGTNPNAEDWEEDEIQKEMRKLERQQATGSLELKELQREVRLDEDDLV